MYQNYNNHTSCNCNPNYNNYYMELIPRLAEYIQDELQDSAYYAALAELAPTQLAKDLIMEFSMDERMHAENFQMAYCILTGNYFVPAPLEPIIIADYEDALKKRIIAETSDYKKYGNEYLMAPDKYLRDLFFNTRTVESIHAMRITILFEEEAD